MRRQFNCKVFLLVILSFFSVQTTHSKINFSGVDLGENDILLFKAETTAPGIGRFNTLFAKNLKTNKVSQLTFYPELVSIVGGSLQIQNRFGIFRTDVNFSNIEAVGPYSTFSEQEAVTSGDINPLNSSPDGQFIAFIDEKNDLQGKLTLIETSTSKRTTISTEVPFSPSIETVLWSPDSQFIVYSKNDKLFYFSIKQLNENRVIAENYRKIGDGSLKKVSWGSSGDLFYLDDNLIYRLDSRELFTRSLYSEMLTVGSLVGRLPFSFDVNFDSFFISPSGEYLLFCKEDRSVILYKVRLQSSQYPILIPHIFLPRGMMIRRVLWTADERFVTILAVENLNMTRNSVVYRADLNSSTRLAELENTNFYNTKDQEVADIIISLDGKRVAILYDDKVEIKDHHSWQNIYTINHDLPKNILWVTQDQIIVAGKKTIKLYYLDSGNDRLLAFSQGDKAGFLEDGETVFLFDGDEFFIEATDNNGWQSTDLARRDAKLATESYRTFLDTGFGKYSNMIMVRDLKRLVTSPLLNPLLASSEFETIEGREELIDFDHFSHGSRVGRRELSIVFNAVDSDKGLQHILRVLRKYNITSTFFVSGDFIRKFPEALVDLSNSGHEVGSLFFVNFNMTDARFRIDKAFIRDGLARNEDEYFQATGNELTTLWHAPFYVVNSTIIDAGKEMNYRYVGRDIDSLDWVTKDNNAAASVYLSAHELAERLIKLKRPGSIIPIDVGVPNGRRDDYLFSKIDGVIDSLIKRGYQLVTVSELVENAK